MTRAALLSLPCYKMPIALAVFGCAFHLFATTWIGGSSGAWNEPANWDGEVPGTGSTVVFTKSVELTHPSGSQMSIKALEFQGDGGYTLSGVQIAFVSKCTISNAGTERVTIENPIYFSGNAWGGASLSGNLRFDGTVTGAGSSLAIYPFRGHSIFNGVVNLKGGQFYADGGGTLEFNAPGNTAGFSAWWGTLIKTGCNYAFDSEVAFNGLGNSGAAGATATFDLGGFDQRVKKLSAPESGNKNGYVTSSTPATLYLVPTDDSSSGAIFQNSAGFILNSADRTFTLSGTSTSAGMLGVMNGTLQVSGSWTSASLLKIAGGHVRPVARRNGGNVNGGRDFQRC